MIALALLVTLVAGARRSLSLSFLYGSGVIFFAMLLLSLLGIEWNRWSVIAAIAVVGVAASFIARDAERIVRTPASSAIDLCTAILVALYALYATAGEPWHWDFWAIWGLKGRVFFEARGIDWQFLQLRANAFAHADYPVLLPLQYAFGATIEGVWNERWLGLLFAAYVAATGGAVRRIAGRETTPVAAAAIAFAVTALTASQYVGLAEVPLMAFAIVGILLVRDRSYTAGAILLGLAASTKNEGLALVVAVAIAVLLFRRREIVRLWPAVLIALPWRIVAARYGFTTDLAAGSPLVRVLVHLRELASSGTLLLGTIDKPLCWLFILLALPIMIRRERFLLLVILVQALFFGTAFLVTPNDLTWHITTSWDRLSRQLLVLSSYAALIALAAHLAGRTNEHDETGSLHH